MRVSTETPIGIPSKVNAWYGRMSATSNPTIMRLIVGARVIARYSHPSVFPYRKTVTPITIEDKGERNNTTFESS
jgi:hypothetical protein